jgi:hypothetical protein
MSEWSRSEKIALFSLLVAIAGVVVALFIPEFRHAMNLNPEFRVSQVDAQSGIPNNSSPSANPASTKIPDRTINYPATRTGWYLIGSGKFRLKVNGEINIGGNVILTPEGWSKLGDHTAFVRGLPFGGVIAKIGNGTPFLVGYEANFDTQEKVYIAINDSTYSDNTGSFTVRIIGQ